tara:strand:- start:2489 stop:2794 length:306 start_codon:yes stop_codon:yes gene_type:complete
MPSLPRNGTIAQPRSYPRRPNPKQIQGATYTNTNSVMNSFFYNGFGLFGSSQSLSRKQATYTATNTSLKNSTKHQQANLEANVGQMDRINRIKANAIQGSK